MPASVLIIGIYLIVYGIIQLFATLLLTSLPDYRQSIKEQGGSTTYLVAWGIVMAGISLASGIGIIGGHNWARLLYFAAFPLSKVVRVIVYGRPGLQQKPGQVFGILVYIVILFVLTRPSIVPFFR